MKSYLFLAVAVAAEVVATSMLKKTDQFTRPWPSLVVAAGYIAAFYFLTLALESIPVSVAYAIWCGLGIVLVTAVAGLVYNQVPDLPAILGIALIIAGVVTLQMFSKMASH